MSLAVKSLPSEICHESSTGNCRTGGQIAYPELQKRLCCLQYAKEHSFPNDHKHNNMSVSTFETVQMIN